MTLAKSYPNMRAPSFRPFRTGPTTCDVHYYSANEGFSPFAIALLGSVARELFGSDIVYEQTSERGVDCDHDIFKLTMPERYAPPARAGTMLRPWHCFVLVPPLQSPACHSQPRHPHPR